MTDILKAHKTAAVEDQIKERIAQGEVHGREVEYWKVLDRIKIARIKG
jgi:translation initiation factor 5A